MKIDFYKATPADNTSLERLFQFFAHDTSEFSGKEIGSDGFYHGLNDLEDYTSQSNYRTYMIQVDGNLAGFVVVRLEETINYLRHYFIVRKYRKQKIGLKAVHRIFDMFPGDWRVSTLDYNLPAIKFWEKTLCEFTNDSYSKMRRTDNKGPQYEFYRS
ncbi:MAG: GNAT family N-acetyltransferase [Clostridiales bacterium]|nr:GNAT family N-acetyltransferase [Clostridiales bacterium]